MDRNKTTKHERLSVKICTSNPRRRRDKNRKGKVKTNMIGKILIGPSYLWFHDKNGKPLLLVGRNYYVDILKAIKTSKHLAEINTTDTREIIIEDPQPQDEDNRII